MKSFILLDILQFSDLCTFFWTIFCSVKRFLYQIRRFDIWSCLYNHQGYDKETFPEYCVSLQIEVTSWSNCNITTPIHHKCLWITSHRNCEISLLTGMQDPCKTKWMENITYFKLSDILLTLFLRHAKEKGGGIEKYLAYRWCIMLSYLQLQ